MGINMQHIADKTNQIKQILDETAFKSSKTNVILQVERLFFEGDMYSIQFGKHIVMVDIKNKLAISNSFSSYFDYMSIVKDLNGLLNTFNFTTVKESEFDDYYLKLLNDGAEVMSVDVMLWKIFSGMLESSVSYENKALRLKLKYMPNLLDLKDELPKQALEIFSSCLMSSKSLEELSKQFDDVSQIDLSRIFILAILSNMSDLEVAYQSVCNNQNVEESTLSNESLQRARKTGFFQRFIKALTK